MTPLAIATDKLLSAHERLVYMLLVHEARHTGIAEISLSEIANLIGPRARHVVKHTARLERLGYLTRETAPGKTTRYRPRDRWD